MASSNQVFDTVTAGLRTVLEIAGHDPINKYLYGLNLPSGDTVGGVTEDSSWPTNLPERGFRFALRQQWSVVARSGDALTDPVSIVEVTAEQR